MYDVRPRLTYVTTHLSHDANVIVAVEERVLVISCYAAASCGGLERLEGCVAQHYYESLGVLVIGSDGYVLLCDELW